MVDRVDGVEVKLGADAGPATSGVDEAARSIAASLQQMQQSLQNFTSTNKQMRDEAVKNTADLSRSFLELKASMTGGFNAITGVVERFRGVLGSLAAVLGGGMLFKGSVDAMLGMEGEVRGLANSMGMTAEKATLLAVNLRLAGVSAETFEMMAQRVGMRIRLQADEFDRLGVKIKDSSGNLLPMDQILQNVYQRMLDFKAGTDQTLFALSTVGRNAKDFSSDMERIQATTNRAAEMVAKLNIEMGPEKIARIEAYRVELNAFKVVLDELGVKVGETILPRLEGLAAWFNEVGPRAIGFLLDALKVLLTVLQALGSLIASIAVEATSDFQNIATSASATWQAVKAAATGNFAAIPGIIATAQAKITANNRITVEEIKRIWQEGADKVNAMWANVPSGGFGMHDRGIGLTGAIPGKGTEHFVPRPAAGSVPTRMEEWEAELKRQQDAFNQMKLNQGSFQTWSVEQTAAYWDQIKARSDLSAKERIDVENRWYDARRVILEKSFAAYMTSLEAEKAALGHNIEAKIAIQQREVDAVSQKYGQESAQAKAEYKKLVDLRQQLADQRLRIADIEQKAELATLNHNMDMAKLIADQDVAMQRISTEQRLALEKTYVDQLYGVELEGMRQRIALMASDPTADPANLAELKRQMLRVEQDYQKRLTEIANAAELEREKYALQAQDAIRSSMADTLAQLVSNTKNWRDTLLSALKALDDQLVKIASNKLVEQMFGAGTAGGDFLSKLTGGIFGGGSATGGASLAAAGTTLTTAGAGLNAAAAALSAAAATLSASGASGIFGSGSLFGGGGSVFGDLGSLFSFDVGTPYVPRDMVAMVHKGEAVIPAALNRPGAYGASVNQRITLNVPAPIDTRTRTQIALEMQRATQRALRASR